MLTINEKKKLKKIAELLNDQKSNPGRRKFNIDITNRLRDKKGRFLPNHESSTRKESQLNLDRPIKLMKVKDSYGTYVIKERWFTAKDRAVLYTFAVITILAIVYSLKVYIQVL